MQKVVKTGPSVVIATKFDLVLLAGALLFFPSAVCLFVSLKDLCQLEVSPCF